MFLRSGLILFIVILFSGCSHYGHYPGCGFNCAPKSANTAPNSGPQPESAIARRPPPAENITLTETGFGAISELKRFSKAQKELMPCVTQITKLT